MTHQPVELESALVDVAGLVVEHLPNVAAASVVLWDKSQEAFAVSASTVPEQPAGVAAREVRGAGGASRWIVDNRKPHAVADIAYDPFRANPLLERYGYRAYVGQPLMVGDEALGVLYALHREPHSYSPEEQEELARVADWAAVAVAEAARAEGARRETRRLQMSHRELRRRLAELRTELVEASMLNGLITICMHCKKVRNQQGEWEPIESYLSQRSEAEFSHGLCSDCSRETYVDPPTDQTLD